MEYYCILNSLILMIDDEEMISELVEWWGGGILSVLELFLSSVVAIGPRVSLHIFSFSYYILIPLCGTPMGEPLSVDA